MVLSRLSFRLRAGVVAMAIAGIGALFTTGGSNAVASNGRLYLALGDSVAFGFITQAGFEYGNPANFRSYSDYAGDEVGFQVTNASCPGEATTGFLSSTGADNGCRAFKASAPLHVSYTGTQMDFATSFLQGHASTQLVTIGLGANDLFILQNSCAGSLACLEAGLPAVLGTIGADMNTILGNIRAAGFKGVLEVVNYYSLDYTDATNTGITELLNQAETASAAAHGAVVADVFTAFQHAAAAAGGHTCGAGLLNAAPSNQFTCDVHPSQSGQALMAQVVESTYFAAGGAG
jgi:lysophospholipase L1-like esterase